MTDVMKQLEHAVKFTTVMQDTNVEREQSANRKRESMRKDVQDSLDFIVQTAHAVRINRHDSLVTDELIKNIDNTVEEIRMRMDVG